MKCDKINNLLRSEELGSAVGNENENLSKFIARQYVKASNLSNTYDENKSIRFKTPMLQSDDMIMQTHKSCWKCSKR